MDPPVEEGEEEWRAVPGWEGYYEVSDRGRVRSLDRGRRRGRILKPASRKVGPPHQFVVLFGNGIHKRVSVHRLVASAFIANPDNHPCVLHWDDNPTNNRVENLRWGTWSDNVVDSVRNGTHWQTRKTSCPRGHPLSGSNLYVRGNGARRCRVCTLEQNRNSVKRRKGEA